MTEAVYWLASGALRLASLGALPRLYRLATRLRGAHPPADLGQLLWCLNELPDRPCRLLDLGTGWVHAYGFAAALVRDADHVDLFDVQDLRNWRSFQSTVEATISDILHSTLPEVVRQRAVQRAKDVQRADSFKAAYAILRMDYHCGSVDTYPSAAFDCIFSVDVLEHVNASIFPQSARSWFEILKPGGLFVAQVGLDDHTAMYSDGFGTKHYLRYSEMMWRIVLGNSVQYINRLPASAIVSTLKNAGFEIVSVATHDCTMQRDEVHPDYRWQSDADIQAVRLFLRARKPEQSIRGKCDEERLIREGKTSMPEATNDARVRTKRRESPHLETPLLIKTRRQTATYRPRTFRYSWRDYRQDRVSRSCRLGR